jgi:phenylalanyl-tRNA synthetase beta chain
MRVSWEWLGSYVDLSGVTPEAIADQLNSAGLEVESIESLGAKFRGVVVGQIQAIEKHPNADKLSLVTVNLGSKTQQVVCGAQNLVQGDLIALAQVGAQVINRKDGSLFTLTPAAIRGVTSEGMICAIEELGLEDQYPQPAQPGIWPINAYARASDLGQPLEIVLGLSADVVLEVAPTANRGDWMSMIGIAREVAALLNRPLTLPSVPQ